MEGAGSGAPEAPVYLDHNATTPLLPEVVDAMLPYLREMFGNPSSGHVYGWRARDAVARARAQVAALLHCPPEEVVFTSGGTEANNLAIRGLAEAVPDRRHVVTSRVEHAATAAPCRWLEAHGYTVDRIGVDETGRVRPDEVRAVLRDDTLLLTVMLANNETGTLQPLAALAPLAHARGARCHADAAQAVGKVRVAVDELGVDLLSLAGHKLYGPKGVGALYVRKGTPLRPLLLGAGHEEGRRAGTENVASIVGLGVACERARLDLQSEVERVGDLRDRLWTRLSGLVPGLALNGHPTERLPNTLSVRFPGVRGSDVLARAPQVAASTGSACHEGGESASAVLLAMGLPPEEALGTVRLTLGRGTTPDEIDRAAAALARAWHEASAG